MPWTQKIRPHEAAGSIAKRAWSAKPRSPGGGRLALGPSRNDVHDFEIAALELLEELRQCARGDGLDVVHEHDAPAGLFEGLHRVLDHLLFGDAVPVER